MGLGKTVSTLTALQQLHDRMDLGKCIVVAPRRVSLRTWQDEIESWDHITLSYSSVIGPPKKRLSACLGQT